ncbi:hypothetical protein RRG08_051338 [Elysia crispata]|uniref:Uncharacterized protein n=1 Tax=Elysia crispata TaxID=231223 RepID=A0AAE1B3M9_9GAST|nr:hypothetical protein RRG08_051338 [Elysia crispata]
MFRDPLVLPTDSISSVYCHESLVQHTSASFQFGVHLRFNKSNTLHSSHIPQVISANILIPLYSLTPTPSASHTLDKQCTDGTAHDYCHFTDEANTLKLNQHSPQFSDVRVAHNNLTVSTDVKTYGNHKVITSGDKLALGIPSKR